MLVCLTVNGHGHYRGSLTFPHPSTDRQQPATDSDASDPLSHIDHPGRVCTLIGTNTNTFLSPVLGIVPLLTTPTFAVIGLSS